MVEAGTGLVVLGVAGLEQGCIVVQLQHGSVRRRRSVVVAFGKHTSKAVNCKHEKGWPCPGVSWLWKE